MQALVDGWWISKSFVVQKLKLLDSLDSSSRELSIGAWISFIGELGGKIQGKLYLATVLHKMLRNFTDGFTVEILI